jgi:uncharacterized protein with HEPN domain
MSQDRTYVDYLQDMLTSPQKVYAFAGSMTYGEFLVDEKTQFAVIRALEIIGEASKKLPQSYKDQHSQIPWRSIAGMRDKVIHNYLNVDPKVIWKTVKEDIPPLIFQLRELVSDE